MHTIGPFIGTHEILRTRRAAIRKAAEYSVLYPQGESLLNVLGHFDVVVLCSAAAGLAGLARGERRMAMATFGVARQGISDCGGMEAVGPTHKVCLRCRVPSAIGLSFERSW